MEMTLSDATEIVTVESKVKKKGRPSRAKPKNKQQTSGSDEAENPVKNLAHSRKSHVEKTDLEDSSLKLRNQEDVLQLSKRQSLKVQSPHMHKKNRKGPKAKLKSRHAEQDSEFCDLDDYFTDPDLNFYESRTTERNGAEVVNSKITCRRSKAKGERASVSRRTFVSGPFLLGEPDSLFGPVKDEEAAGLANSHQPRQTFIMWDHSSPTAASSSSSAGLMEPDTRTVTAARDPSASQTTSFSSPSDPCQRLPSSCEGSSQANQDFAAPSAHPNRRKTGKTDKKHQSKKEGAQNGQRTCEEEKHDERSCLSNESSRCSVKAPCVVDNVNVTQTDGEAVGGSARGEEAGSSQQFYGRDLDALKLRVAPEPRNLRNTFVIHQQDDAPSSSRQSLIDANSHMINTRDELENFGDMLVDERPPWLTTDPSAAVASEATPGIYVHQLWFTRTNHLLNYSCNFAFKPAEY